MQKEIVTLENIKQDLISQMRSHYIACLGCMLCFWFISVSVGAFWGFLGRKNPFVVITTIAVFVCGLILYFAVLNIDKVKKGNFTLRQDVIVDKCGRASEFPTGRTVSGAPRLLFSQGDIFPITNIQYYKWTGFPRSGKTIFELADIGDSFVLIELNKRVWVVYNERFFDVSLALGSLK